MIDVNYAYKCDNCKKICFYFSEKHEEGEMINGSDVMLINGKTAEMGSTIKCPLCGYVFIGLKANKIKPYKGTVKIIL